MKVCEIDVLIQAAGKTFRERVISINTSAVELPRGVLSMRCSTFFVLSKL